MFKPMRFLTLLTGLMLISVLVSAQGLTTAAINGKVVDSKGVSLPGATVIALHVPSGSSYGTTTRADGNFDIPALRIGGPYKLTVSFVGYKEHVEENIKLALGENRDFNIQLQEESVSLAEVVVVGVADKTFNSSRTGAANNVTTDQISKIPTMSRSITDMTRLTPQSSGYSFAGRNNLYNNLSIDGSVFNNSFGLASTPGGQTNSQPISLDAIEEIQVSLAPYDVRQSGFTGAGINAITRSGSNKLEASVYTFWRNQNLVGDQVAGTKVTSDNFKQKQIGFRVGGPIINDKIFFFMNAEIERRDDPAHTFLAGRAGLTGDNVSSVQATDLDALKDFLINKFNYNPGTYEGYKINTYSDKFLVRFDYNINKSNKFSIRYNYLKSNKDNLPSTSNSTGGRSNGLNYLGFSNNMYKINNNINSIIGELNSVFGNWGSNNFVVGWTGFRDFRSSESSTFPMVDILSNGATYTSFGYEQFSVNNTLNTDVFQISDNFTYYSGAHTFTGGGSLESFKFENGFMPQYDSYYRYNSMADFYDDVNNGGLAAPASLSSFQLQYSAIAGDAAPFAKIKAAQLGLYVQDEYKVSNRLKMTFGLRVDMPFYPDNLRKNAASSALNFIEGSSGQTEKLDVAKLPKTTPLWSPRFGFNYDVMGDRSTQVRGGVGVFTGRIPFVWISNQASNNGLLWGRVVGSNTRLYPFNPNVGTYIPANPTLPATYEIDVTAENFKFPQVFRTNLAVDQKLPFGIIGTVEGIYTRDLNAVYHRNDNLVVPTAKLPDGRDLFPTTRNINASITGAYVLDNTNKGYSYFGTVQLEKTFNFGLYMMAAYTYGVSADVTSNPGSVASSTFNGNYIKNNPNKPQIAFSNYDQPHKLVGTVSYKINYLKKFSSSVSLVYIGSKSGRYSYLVSGDLNRDGASNDLVYIPKDISEITLVPLANGGTTANPIVDTRTPQEIWDQLNAYIEQDDYLKSHRGQIADRNASVYPWVNQVDLRFTQDIAIDALNKKNTLQFTFDVMNLGNLINSDWGVYKSVNNVNLLTLRSVTGGPNGEPTFSFPYLNFTDKTPLTETYRNSTSLGSRWQIQLGIRYIFE